MSCVFQMVLTLGVFLFDVPNVVTTRDKRDIDTYEDLEVDVDANPDDWCADNFFDTRFAVQDIVTGQVHVEGPAANYRVLLLNAGYTVNDTVSDEEVDAIFKKTVIRVRQYPGCTGNQRLCTYGLAWEDMVIPRGRDRTEILNRLNAAFAKYKEYYEKCSDGRSDVQKRHLKRHRLTHSDSSLLGSTGSTTLKEFLLGEGCPIIDDRQYEEQIIKGILERRYHQRCVKIYKTDSDVEYSFSCPCSIADSLLQEIWAEFMIKTRSSGEDERVAEEREERLRGIAERNEQIEAGKAEITKWSQTLQSAQTQKEQVEKAQALAKDVLDKVNTIQTQAETTLRKSEQDRANMEAKQQRLIAKLKSTSGHGQCVAELAEEKSKQLVWKRCMEMYAQAGKANEAVCNCSPCLIDEEHLEKYSVSTRCPKSVT